MHGRPEITRASPLRSLRLLRAALCLVRAFPVHRCPGSVPPSTSPLSEPPRLCVPLPPPPRLRLPPLRASSPAGRTGSEAGRCAGCRAGGRRAWAEPGAGTGGGGWGVGTEASGPPRGCCGDWEEGTWGGEEVWSRRRRRGLESRAPTWGPR